MRFTSLDANYIAHDAGARSAPGEAARRFQEVQCGSMSDMDLCSRKAKGQQGHRKSAPTAPSVVNCGSLLAANESAHSGLRAGGGFVEAVNGSGQLQSRDRIRCICRPPQTEQLVPVRSWW